MLLLSCESGINCDWALACATSVEQGFKRFFCVVC